MRCALLASLCLMLSSCKSKQLAPAAAVLVPSTTAVHERVDTVVRDGKIVTIVVHDTVHHQPRTITTTQYQERVINKGTTYIVRRDTVFLPSTGTKQARAKTSKAAIKKAVKPKKIGWALVLLMIVVAFAAFCPLIPPFNRSFYK